MGSDVHRIPESACLGCGYKIDASGSPDGRPTKGPQPGNLSICLRCGAVMAYAEDLSLRPLTDDEVREISQDDDAMRDIAHITKGIHFVRATLN